MTSSLASIEPPVDFDPSRRFVRVLERQGKGFVLFEFAIGWPDLAVELLMPEATFEAFCASNQVVRLAD